MNCSHKNTVRKPVRKEMNFAEIFSSKESPEEATEYYVLECCLDCGATRKIR